MRLLIFAAATAAAAAGSVSMPSGDFDCDDYVHTDCWEHGKGSIGRYKWDTNWPPFLWQEMISPGSCVTCGHGDEKDVQRSEYCTECPDDFPNLYPFTETCSGVCLNDAQLRVFTLRNIRPIAAYRPFDGKLICEPWSKCSGSGPSPRPDPRPRPQPRPSPTKKPVPAPTREPTRQPTSPRPRQSPMPTKKPLSPMPTKKPQSAPVPRPTKAPKTKKPTGGGPTPSGGGGCPKKLKPLKFKDCPKRKASKFGTHPITTATCDAPGLIKGDYCEADGECGTDKDLNNCPATPEDEDNGDYYADLYEVKKAAKGGSSSSGSSGGKCKNTVGFGYKGMTCKKAAKKNYCNVAKVARNCQKACKKC